MTVLHYLFSVRGRINRAKFWAFYLVAMAAELVGLTAQALAFGGGAMSEQDTEALGPQLWPGIAIILAVGVPLIYAQIAVYVKRLHDRDKSAWWLAVFYGPSLLLFPIMFWTVRQGENTFPPILIAVFLVASACQAWGTIETHFLRGTVGDNRYGADPLAL